MNFVFVGLGGAIGAVFRYSISLIPYKGAFPILTLITNLIGAIVIGFIVGIAAEKQISDGLTLFIKTGFCGGFTTFSTFSLEAYNLFCNGFKITAIVYSVLSLCLCILGIWLGMFIASIVVKS